MVVLWGYKWLSLVERLGPVVAQPALGLNHMEHGDEGILVPAVLPQCPVPSPEPPFFTSTRSWGEEA